MSDEIVTRMLDDEIQIEERSGGQAKITGYGCVFNNVYPIGDGAYERILPQALDNADMTQTECRYNHSNDFILGDVPTNTLQLRPDARGLYYSTDFDDGDPDFVKCRSKIRKGLVKGSSIGMKIDHSFPTMEDGKTIYNIDRISYVRDLGPVNTPANSQAPVSCRAHEDARKEYERIEATRKRRENKTM